MPGREHMRVDFYHLLHLPAGKALPKLLEKPYSMGMRVFTLTRSREETAALDDSFWTYTTLFFLPHGTVHDPQPERQPVLIGEDLSQAVNRPDVIASVGPAVYEAPEGCSRVLYMFDGTDENAAAEARAYWKALGQRLPGVEKYYRRQDPKGGWTEQT